MNGYSPIGSYHGVAGHGCLYVLENSELLMRIAAEGGATALRRYGFEEVF